MIDSLYFEQQKHSKTNSKTFTKIMNCTTIKFFLIKLKIKLRNWLSFVWIVVHNDWKKANPAWLRRYIFIVEPRILAKQIIIHLSFSIETQNRSQLIDSNSIRMSMIDGKIINKLKALFLGIMLNWISESRAIKIGKQ